MMKGVRPSDRNRARVLDAALSNFSSTTRPLTGLTTRTRQETLIAQIIESERRQNFLKHLANTPPDQTTTNPLVSPFSPLHAIVSLKNQGNVEEALWLAFLATHFGKSSVSRWELCRAFYGGIGAGPIHTFAYVKNNLQSVQTWISTNRFLLGQYRFGNHRKYQSIHSPQGKDLRKVIASYIDKFGTYGQKRTIDLALHGINDPKERFEVAYKLFSSVYMFGRLGTFDHVSTLGHLGLINAVPGHPYLRGATGPLSGSRLLLGEFGTTNSQFIRTNNSTLQDLAAALGVDGQVIEDSLCNWQKSPSDFKPFR